jgi:hypothetical protein
MMLRHFGPQVAFATIHHAIQTPGDLLESICTEFVIPYKTGAGPTHLVRALHDFLLAQFAQNIPVVLVLDEAQNLSVEGFEQLRMIGNLEADDAKLLQIAIVGQPELRQKFQSPSLWQLQQRIFRTYHLPALDRQAVEGYVHHRLSVVTDTPDGLFDESAIDAIYDHSCGLPRLINTICDNALLSAYSAERKKIDGPFVNAVVAHMMSVPPDTRRAPCSTGGTDDAGDDKSCKSTATKLPASRETGADRVIRSIKGMSARVERMEAELRRQGTGSGAGTSDTATWLDAPASPVPEESGHFQLALRRTVRDVVRRVGVIERRMAEGATGALPEARAVRAKLEEAVRQARSVLSEMECAARESAEREKALHDLKATVQAAETRLAKTLDRLRQTTAHQARTEERARAIHARLAAQAERSRTLADDLTRLRAPAGWPPSQETGSGWPTGARIAAAVESWRRLSHGGATGSAHAEQLETALTRTQESLKGLRELVRTTPVPATTTPHAARKSGASEEPPTARLARQVEGLLEFVEPDNMVTPCEAKPASLGQTADEKIKA